MQDDIPIFSDYRKYKSFLREEFSYACVYCDTRERELGGAQSFHIDHYKPKNRFPKLKCKYDNLLYSCRDCNQYKGAYWPNFTQRLHQEIILNPRIHSIDKHIDKSEHKWAGTTKQGRWNIEQLRLASDALIQRREDRADIEEKITDLEIEMENYPPTEIAKLRKLVDALKRKIAVGPLD